jgi:hypothetical protein
MRPTAFDASGKVVVIAGAPPGIAIVDLLDNSLNLA